MYFDVVLFSRGKKGVLDRPENAEQQVGLIKNRFSVF
jgi:hypothetical protein